ncbi:hypothetical protein MASR2M15_16380 [Anaerolineales bacterium]
MSLFKKWSLVNDIKDVTSVRIFSGGACNVLNEQGQLLRNIERDPINDWLTEKNIPFFDPQIHPDTHGQEYDYLVHHPLEVAARDYASINLYELSPRTFGAITSLEIAVDQFQFNEPMIIYFSDGEEGEDRIPEHSKTGYPLFRPRGIESSPQAMQAHYQEFIKNGNNVRKYLMSMARKLDTLTITFDDNPHKGDIVIFPHRIQAADMFQAVVSAASGERVFVNFHGQQSAHDDHGYPAFVMPATPSKIEMQALLDQYIDEGNELRRRIAELVKINVYTRVVYTQRSAILALDEIINAMDIELKS